MYKVEDVSAARGFLGNGITAAQAWGWSMPGWLEKMRVASSPVGMGGGSAEVGKLQGVSWQEAAVGKWDASAVTNNDGLGMGGWREEEEISPH